MVVRPGHMEAHGDVHTSWSAHAGVSHMGGYIIGSHGHIVHASPSARDMVKGTRMTRFQQVSP